MNDPEESQSAADCNDPIPPVSPDILARLSKIETDVAKILAILEAPQVAEIARQTEEAEAARKLAEGYASGDIGYTSG